MLAARQLGLAEVPAVSLTDLSVAALRTLRLALNRITDARPLHPRRANIHSAGDRFHGVRTKVGAPVRCDEPTRDFSATRDLGGGVDRASEDRRYECFVHCREASRVRPTCRK